MTSGDIAFLIFLLAISASFLPWRLRRLRVYHLFLVSGAMWFGVGYGAMWLGGWL